MKHVAIFILSILLSTSSGFGQTRTITGKVIDAQFYPIYQARINNYDTALLVTTDVNGNFKIDIPVETKSLIVSWIGMEWKLINLPSSCDHLEIIMISSGTYDLCQLEKLTDIEKKSLINCRHFINLHLKRTSSK